MLLGLEAVRTRPSGVLTDSVARPVFLPSVPERKPRTLWACQPVAAMMSASVAPSARRSISRTMAFFEPSREGFAALRTAEE